jgi:putative transcriptional regulator
MSIPTLNLNEHDINVMVQAVIDDDPDAIAIKDSLTLSLRQLSQGEVGRVTSPAIVKTRQQTGLSQRQFADRLGISINTLQSWEQGQRKPSGAAASLIKLIDKHPELVDELA